MLKRIQRAVQSMSTPITPTGKHLSKTVNLK
jgi:hypothetical protein